MDGTRINENPVERPPARPGIVTVERYGSRNWAVYEDGELLCVTLYKRGAKAVAERIKSCNCQSPGTSQKFPS
jgi:hypothetical protein